MGPPATISGGPHMGPPATISGGPHMGPPCHNFWVLHGGPPLPQFLGGPTWGPPATISGGPHVGPPDPEYDFRTQGFFKTVVNSGFSRILHKTEYDYRTQELRTALINHGHSLDFRSIPGQIQAAAQLVRLRLQLWTGVHLDHVFQMR